MPKNNLFSYPSNLALTNLQHRRAGQFSQLQCAALVPARRVTATSSPNHSIKSYIKIKLVSIILIGLQSTECVLRALCMRYHLLCLDTGSLRVVSDALHTREHASVLRVHQNDREKYKFVREWSVAQARFNLKLLFISFSSVVSATLSLLWSSIARNPLCT